MRKPPHANEVSDVVLDAMQYRADPLADATIARILGNWHVEPESQTKAALLAANADQWARLAAVTRVFAQWDSNRKLDDDELARIDAPPDIAQALGDYVRAARKLPTWADECKIARAERLFFEHGVLSCTLLFCASLPECYVVPDLAEVLHLTGQLERRAEYRIRSTAAMIFPVMMQGGLTSPEGGGLAQVLKVRLIHATIRHLILRCSPDQAMQALAEKRRVDKAGVLVVPELPELSSSQDMHQALFAHGWNLGAVGLPCNQEEQAYTLLTFGYVFLRGLRKLGVGFSPDDEEAYLHAWNVVGHLVGIERELMADTMEDAERLFAQLQGRGRAEPVTPDPRPKLAQALMKTMEDIIPVRVAKPFPVLLTRYLCGRRVSSDLGLTQCVSWPSRLLFKLLMYTVRGFDAAVRLWKPRFSIARSITRVVGLRFMAQILMDQTRPLKLPEHVLGCANRMMVGWGARR